MKKLLGILALLAGVLLLFVGCPNTTGGDNNDPDVKLVSSLEASGATKVVSSKDDLSVAMVSLMADPLIQELTKESEVDFYVDDGSRATLEDVNGKIEEWGEKIEQFVTELSKNYEGNIQIRESFDTIDGITIDGAPVEGIELNDVVFGFSADVRSERNEFAGVEVGLPTRIYGSMDSEIGGKISIKVSDLLNSAPADSGFDTETFRTGVKQISARVGEGMSLSEVDVDVIKVSQIIGGLGGMLPLEAASKDDNEVSLDLGIKASLALDAQSNIAFSYADANGLGGKFLVHVKISMAKTTDDIVPVLIALIAGGNIDEEAIVNTVLSLFDYEAYIKVFDDDNSQKFEQNVEKEEAVALVKALIEQVQPEY